MSGMPRPEKSSGSSCGRNCSHRSSASSRVASPSPPPNMSRSLPRAGAHHPPHHVGAVVRHVDGVAPHLAAAHAGGIARADDRADRGAGDGDRLHAHLVQRLEHRQFARAPRAPPPPSASANGLHFAPPRGRSATRSRPAAAPSAPCAGGVLAGRGAVAHAAGDALQDRGDAEEVVGEIDREMRPRIEPGARDVQSRRSRPATECRAPRDRSRPASRCRRRCPPAACATASGDR